MIMMMMMVVVLLFDTKYGNCVHPSVITERLFGSAAWRNLAERWQGWGPVICGIFMMYIHIYIYTLYINTFVYY